jgi:serine/threonine-protein kinase
MDRLATLLEGALAVPLAQRDTFVRQACGDDLAMCTELGSLLDAHGSAPDYFADLTNQVVSPAYAALTGALHPAPDTALLSQLRAAIGSMYRIEKELGGGGMSRVFLAEEIKLARKVVVKVLPPAMSATVSADRFRREIRVAAQLQHPHIVPLLTADSSNSLLYYTMPFVVGESLRARLARDGALTVADAIWIWRDVLDALAHAHTGDVVHRDIKPANILLGTRHAHVIDFGIAQAIEGAAEDAPTSAAGFAIGTPAYMAPEQITGDLHADHRVDLYAAGLVMYEMLEGRLPFSGMSSRDLAVARLTGDPAPLARHDCPPELRDLVMRCIAKDPLARPASAEQALTALESLPVDVGIAVAAGSVSDPSPRRHALRSRRMRRGLTYGVAVLTVAAAAFGASRARQGPSNDAAVASSPSSPAVIPRSPRYTPNIAAYEWYVRGMDVALMRSDSGRRQGATYFQLAIAEDSNFAAAYAGLVRMYLPQANRGTASDDGWLALAEQAATKAVSLDDSLAEAHAALGWIRMVQKDFATARAEMTYAIALDPNVARGHEGLARLYMWTGPPAEQLAAARIGLENDPYSHSAIRELALALMMNGQCDEALERLRPLKALRPIAGVTGVVAGQCYASQEMWPEAIAEFRWSMANSGALTAAPLLGFALARAGRREEATAILTELLAGRMEGHGAMGIAMVYAGLGDHDQAFAWLDKSSDQTLSAYILGPMFRDLHRDPRFARFKKRIGI